MKKYVSETARYSSWLSMISKYYLLRSSRYSIFFTAVSPIHFQTQKQRPHHQRTRPTDCSLKKNKCTPCFASPHWRPRHLWGTARGWLSRREGIWPLDPVPRVKRNTDFLSFLEASKWTRGQIHIRRSLHWEKVLAKSFGATLIWEWREIYQHILLPFWPVFHSILRQRQRQR